MGYRDRLESDGPRKLLALDGGGIRGVLSLEILAAIEDIVRTQAGQGCGPCRLLRLHRGYQHRRHHRRRAIAEACPCQRSATIYHEHGEEMFDKAFILDRYRFKFDSDRLQAS